MEVEKAMAVIPQKGTDRPALKYLNRYIKADIATEWHDIGVELLDVEDEPVLNTIKNNYPGDANKCTAEMLQLWLARKPEASWNRLIEVFREPNIKLNTLAAKVEAMLSKDSDTTLHGVPSDTKRKQTETKSDDYSFKSIDFTTIDKVSNAFSKLFSTFQEATDALSDKEFQRIKNACVTRTDRTDERLCTSLQCASDSEHLFGALAPHCNWMCIEYLETIAYAYKNDSLLNLVKDYSHAIFSKTLREVWNYLPFYSVKDKYYAELSAIFEDKDPDDLTVEELNQRKPQLAKEIAMLITIVRIQSLLISWLIPTNQVYQTYLSFLTVPQQSRKDILVKFGNWRAYLPQIALKEQQKKFGMLPASTLLIGYYHGLLLRDTNADSLIGALYSNGLLSAQELNVILSGHSFHHRNWLLLEYIRHMDSQALLVFSELVKDVWPQIGIQLVTAVRSDDDDDDHSKFQEENSAKLIFGITFSYIETVSVLTVFFQVSDSVMELVTSSHVEELFDVCENLMASDKHAVNFFSDNQMKSLKMCNNSHLLLQRLSLFFTWSNHSVLRVLAGQCTEAMNILDNFICSVDPFEFIMSYPIPSFSLNMIPIDGSSHTILAIVCNQELYESTLQDVYDMQSVMMEKCDITLHCLQLLAIRNNPSIFYWTIPKCVVCIINSNVPLYSEYLQSRGILEVLVYPNLQFKFSDRVSIGLLAFCDDSKLVERKQLDKTQEYYEIYDNNKFLQETVEHLKADKIAMGEELDDLNTKLQTLNVNKTNEQLYDKMTNIKLENVQLHKQIKQLKLELQEMTENNNELQKITEENQLNEQKSTWLHLELQEITEKKDELNKQNKQLSSELLAINKRNVKLNQQNEQLLLQLQMVGKNTSKRNDNDDRDYVSMSDTDDFMHMDDIDDEDELVFLSAAPVTSKLDHLSTNNKEAEAIYKLSEWVSQVYEQMEFTVDDDIWPPEDLKYFIMPQFLIHYYSMVKLTHTNELTLVASDQSQNPKLYDNKKTLQEALDDTAVTEKFKEILAPLENNVEPCLILIGGAPGIGKSVLLKEIAYRWSKKQLLQLFRIVLLVSLHEPILQQAVSLPNLLQYYCKGDREIAYACSEYFIENGGKDLVFLFDGFDKLPEILPTYSVIKDILERRILPYCGLIVSSCPHSIQQFHKQATLSIDIVGFTKKEQLYYIQQVLQDQPHKIKELTKYFEHHLTIGSLCHIPFNLVVLLYLYKQGICFPKNAAEMYNRFIVHTICQHLTKHGHPSNITKLTDLPEPCSRIVQQLSSLSLEALNDNKSIFTVNEIKASCPDITVIPGAINGFGLLQKVKNYGFYETIGTFSFLHFSIQVYLAAHRVTNLPADEELRIIERKFWSNTHINMFSMYTALTNGQRSSFKHFLSGGDKKVIISDKFLDNQLQCIHLYRCFHEVGDTELCKSLEESRKFSNGKINLTYNALTANDLESVAIFLTSSSHKKWVILDLSSCYIQDYGLRILHRRLCHHSDIITINKVWLINNHLTIQSSSFISEIIIKCKVKELVISGNYFIGEDQQLYSMLTSPFTVLEELDISGTKLTNRAAINLFEALKDNGKLKKLHITHNSFTDDACNAITVAMKKNHCLERLIMYGNQLTGEAIVNIMNSLQDNNTLANIWLPKCSENIKKTIYSLEKIINKNRENQGCQIKLMIKL